jgi:hypothetical protein
MERPRPVARHAIPVQRIERWLGSASPNEASKKAKLKMLMTGCDPAKTCGVSDPSAAFELTNEAVRLFHWRPDGDREQRR